MSQQMSKMTTEEMLLALREKYCHPEWVTAIELEMPSLRRVDFIAVNTFPSRGFEIYGFELKTSRSDILKEIKDLEKSEGIAAYCDRYFIVAGDTKLIEPEELPAPWGLLLPHGNSLRIKKQAKPTDRLDWDMRTWTLFTRRAVMRDIGENEIEKMIREAKNRGYKEGKKTAATYVDWDEKDYERLKEQVRKFQEITGIEITTYNGEKLGKQVKIIQELGIDNIIWRTRTFRKSLEKLTSIVDKVNEKIKIAEESLIVLKD